MARLNVYLTNNIKLSYDLIDHEITTSWSNLIQAKTVTDLCPINHYVGYASEEMIQSMITRLYELADTINTEVPNRVVKQVLSKSDWAKPLHLMHIHFPDLKNNEAYKHIWNVLSEYNDIIHWLESILRNVWESNTLTESSLFRITLDFNKSHAEFLPIPDDAYRFFTPFVEFGDLMLHYTHVGKHPHEIFTVHDEVCPKDQVVPQRTFSASVRMQFTDNFYKNPATKTVLLHKWKQFYNLQGGKDYWGLDINDPKLAFGYLKIGKLVDTQIPKGLDEMCEFRKLLVSSKVTHWEVE